MSPHNFGLLHPVLTRIGDTNTEPTFATILIANVELNANVASIYSTRGDGVHGHLALTINAANYKQRSIGGVAFQVPTAHPAFPSHKDKATYAEIAEDAILRNLIIAVVPTIFLAAKRNTVTGFGNVPCMSLLNHLHAVYGHITEKELEQNIQHMRTQ
jgi:hypothetical protein